METSVNLKEEFIEYLYNLCNYEVDEFTRQFGHYTKLNCKLFSNTGDKFDFFVYIYKYDEEIVIRCVFNNDRNYFKRKGFTIKVNDNNFEIFEKTLNNPELHILTNPTFIDF